MENRNLEQLNIIADACSVGCDDLATNGEVLDTLYMMAESGQLNAGDGTMVVDNALNTESINPVQNKVIARLIPAEADSINKLADKKFVNDAIAAHADGYVAKEDGKGLSSCDFTIDLAEKLVSLENYDDSDLRNQIINKVDKIEGKGLSTNDFTNEYKTKLDELTSPDTNNLQSLIASKADVDHTHDEYLVLSDLDGKVDKIAGKGLSTNDYTDEEKVKVENLSTFGENFNNQLANKVDKVEGKGLSTNDYTNEEKEKVANLANFNDSSLRDLIATKADTTHSHTEYVERVELDRKVDKVDGKGLSSNDFTNEYKTKLDTLVSYNDAELQAKITNVETLIPNQASEANQLADKNFVNSSIATASAKFIGTFNSLASLQQSSGQDLNDYAFVHGLDDLGNTTYNRYKWNGSEWLFEYKLNNSSFTAEQWNNINNSSGRIDDENTSAETTWSSENIASKIGGKLTGTVNEYSGSCSLDVSITRKLTIVFSSTHSSSAGAYLILSNYNIEPLVIKLGCHSEENFKVTATRKENGISTISVTTKDSYLWSIVQIG